MSSENRAFRDSRFEQAARALRGLSKGQLNNALIELVPRTVPGFRPIAGSESITAFMTMAEEQSLLQQWFHHYYRDETTAQKWEAKLWELLREAPLEPIRMAPRDELWHAREVVRAALLMIGHDQLLNAQSEQSSGDFVNRMLHQMNEVPVGRAPLFVRQLPAACKRWLEPLTMAGAFDPHARPAHDQAMLLREIGCVAQGSSIDLINGVFMLIGRAVVLAQSPTPASRARTPTAPVAVRPPTPIALMLVISSKELDEIDPQPRVISHTVVENWLFRSIYFSCVPLDQAAQTQQHLILTEIPTITSGKDVFLRIEIDAGQTLLDETSKFGLKQHLPECGPARLVNLRGVDTLASSGVLARFTMS